MPARVEYRLGSIFDEQCDVIVIPSSTGGTVTQGVAADLRKADILFPGATPWGTIVLSSRLHPRFGVVVYAASVQENRSSPAIVEELGRRLGGVAHPGGKVAAPLLGTGVGDVPPQTAAAALERGFLASAPDGALLMISIRDPELFAALNEQRPLRNEPSVPFSAIRHGDEDAGLTRAEKRENAGQSAPGELMRAPKPKRTRVFISYSHEDAKWLRQLQKHLRPLERDGAHVWDDTRLKAGASWRDEIRQALDETTVAVLLVSAAFMASDFINTDELPPLLKAAEEDGATILPVIISASRFDRTPSLSRFQAVNNPQKPLAKLPPAGREEVLDKVARAVEDALTR